MSKSVPNSPRNQHELMKSNTLPPTAIPDTAANNGSSSSSNKNVSASPSRRSRGASLTNFLKKLSPKLRQNSLSPMKLLKERQPSVSDASVEEEPIEIFEEILIATSADIHAKEGISEPTCSSHVGSQLLLITQAASGSGSSSPSEGNLGGGGSVRRTQQPPKTLNILNKIVVHPPPLEMERVKNKIASVESIGSCSLDADGTSSESSVTIDGRASSVSQRTLLSASCGATSSTPKASLTETESVAATTERRTSNKHVSKLYIPNGNEDSGHISNGDCQVDGERKKPSYIGISCSVSGYSNYSCYDSKIRQEGLRSRDNSPARLAFNNHGENQRRTVDIEIDEMNGGLTYSSCEVHKSEASVVVNGGSSNGEIKKVTAFTMWRASSEDGILNGSGGSISNGSSNHSYKEIITKSSQHLNSKEVLTISTTPTKSLIQQRIERLYGPGALAQGFRKHAEIKNKNNEQLSGTKAKVSSSHIGEVAKTNGTTRHSNVNNISQPKVITSPAKNGQNFIDAMNKEKERISRMINKSEDYLNIEELPEEAKGIIRAAIGKANLLISRKFRQFQGLCEKNLAQLPDEPFPTTVEDLTGFWDMVLIQVDDINRAFETIEKANASGWKSDEIDSSYQTRDSKVGKKVRKVKANAGTTTTKSENESALSKSRAEARKKLMELKCKGRQQKTGTGSTNGIEIYVADDRLKC